MAPGRVTPSDHLRTAHLNQLMTKAGFSKTSNLKASPLNSRATLTRTGSLVSYPPPSSLPHHLSFTLRDRQSSYPWEKPTKLSRLHA